MNWLTKEEWSPYGAGGLVGVLNWFAILTVDPPGVSTTSARTAAMIEKIFGPGHVANLPYFAKYGLKIDWQWMLVLGTLIGAGIYAEVYALIKGNLLTWGSLRKITLPSVFGINHWIMSVILWILLVPLMRWFGKIGR